MTNIMAVTVPYGNDRAVYVCSDSQSSGGRDKTNVQKLVSRGGNLITATGKGYRIEAIQKNLLELEGQAYEPSYVAQRIFDDFQKKFKLRSKKDGEAYIVAGHENKVPSICLVEINELTLDPKSGIEPVQRRPYVFRGSGSSRTNPDFQRDIEKGNFCLDDIPEGMVFCISYGEKASGDIAVDDKLQLGLIMPERTSLIYHPQTRFPDYFELVRYLFTNLGNTLTETDDFLRAASASPEELDLMPDEIVTPGIENVSHLYATFNDLYICITIASKIVDNIDHRYNSANTRLKTCAESEKNRIIKSRDQELGRRDEAKIELSRLLMAWISGDITAIKEALHEYNSMREEKHGKASDFIQRLKAQR